jgi:hypothetical protein
MIAKNVLIFSETAEWESVFVSIKMSGQNEKRLDKIRNAFLYLHLKRFFGGKMKYLLQIESIPNEFERSHGKLARIRSSSFRKWTNMRCESSMPRSRNIMKKVIITKLRRYQRRFFKKRDRSVASRPLSRMAVNGFCKYVNQNITLRRY